MVQKLGARHGKSTRASPEDCYVVAKVKLARPGQSAFIAFSEQIIR